MESGAKHREGKGDVPLFKGKPKVDAANFCRQWYDRFVFASELEGSGANPSDVFIDEFSERLQETGVDVVLMDWDLFSDEMYALRLELFGTAYAHRTREKVPLGAAETAATKLYLSERGRSDLWDRMLIYNQTIATGPATRGTKALTLMLDQMRVSLFNEYAKIGADADCAVRAVNRVGTSVDFLKIAPDRLGYVLAGQMNLEPSDGIVLVLGATAQGFYNGARESLGEVEFQA
jgi:hypothetical protein